MTGFDERHESLLKRALAAIGDRGYFSAFQESASPKVYGERAKAEGDAAFEAAFSDYHVTGGNQAGSATLTDAAFVANRFRIAPVRLMAA